MSSDRRNCYFHARDLGCLKLVVELSDVNPSYLYMSNANIKKLTKEHIEELEKVVIGNLFWKIGDVYD